MEKKWDLSELIPPPGSKGYKQFLQELEGEVKKVELVRSKLNNFTGNDLLQVIKTKERIEELSNRLGAYAYLGYSTDTHNSEARAFLSQMENLGTDLSNRLLFFNLWFKNLEEKKARELMKTVPKYHYFLERIRETKPYSLLENEEKIINLKSLSGTNALVKIYDLVSASLTFEMTVNGKKKALSEEELRNFAKNPDAKLRASAYQELMGVFGKQGQVLGEVYRNIVTDWKNECLTLRKYPSSVSVRNISNDIPQESYDALISSVRKNAPIFEDYFKMKFKLCGVKDFSRYHIYAPYGAKEKQYSYETAVKMVMENFNKFSPKMAQLAQNLVTKNHIDVPIRKGKRSGAYCYSITPQTTPYVLLNYDGSMRNVFTLAHELGHAVHGQLYNGSILNYNAPIPVCETASIFSEMLLFDKLLDAEKDVEAKKALLVMKIDDIYASIQRQTYFTIFEENAHRMVGEGAGVDELKKEYAKELKEQFGSMKVPEEFSWEWVAIPHMFHSPFYCYGYAFGNLLVLALYNRYKEEGSKFIPKYLKILEYGGSERPKKMLDEVGFDINSEKFWNSGFHLIGNLVNDLKRLK